MDRIAVVGSLNIDLVARVDKFPIPGQTVHGSSLDFICGGKGGNQAVTASKLGLKTYMFGMMGNDVHASMYERVFTRANTNFTNVETSFDTSTGMALIEVEEGGENKIIIVDGANAYVTPEYIKRHELEITACKYLMLQLEIPMKSVVEAARLVKEEGGVVILDPSPAAPLPRELLKYVDYMTPNESEIAYIAKGADLESSCNSLLKLGVGAVICTMGSKGLYYADNDKTITRPSYKVKAVDTTGAGDSFNAGFACALNRGYSIEQALDYASAAAALTIQTIGAQSEHISHHMVVEFMTKNQI